MMNRSGDPIASGRIRFRFLFVFQYDTEPRIGGETPYVAMTANADVRTAIAVSFGRVNMFSKVLTGVSIAVYSNIKRD